MAVTTDAVTSANIALREATAALGVKRDISTIAPHLDASACEALTADVGSTLDAVLRLRGRWVPPTTDAGRAAPQE